MVWQTRRYLGCPACWEVFKSDIVPLLKKLHGAVSQKDISVKHVSSNKVESKIQKLRLKLREAVEKEEYEEAARIRDEIKALEKNKK